MAYTLIDTSPIQIQKNAAGNSASGYYLKLYAAGTSTPISMYTTSVGGGPLAKCEINSVGFTINGSGDVFIPYVNQSYRWVVYTNATDADNNNFAAKFYEQDNIPQVSGSPGYGDKPYDMTLAEFKASTILVAGDVVVISDRAGATFDIASGVSGANTFDVIANNAGTLKATLRINNNIFIPTHFGAKGDNSTDDYAAIAAMVAAGKTVENASNSTVIFDFGGLYYKLSQPLYIEDIDFLQIIGSFRLTSTHSGTYVIWFEGCAYLVLSGAMNVRGNGVTSFSTRTNLYGAVFNNCFHMSLQEVNVYYCIADGIRITEGTSQSTIAKSEVGYCGSGYAGATSAPTSTLSSQLQSGGVNSASQRDVLTLSSIPQQLKDYIDEEANKDYRACFISINGDLHWIESYSGSTITVWPWVNTAHVGGTVNFIFGSGIFGSGSDNSVCRIDNFSPVVCGIGYAAYALYPASLGALTTQYCGIGLLQGRPTSGAAVGLDVARGYFEANIFDIIQGSQADNAISIQQTTALNFAKCQRLYSGNSTGTRQTTRFTSASITDDYGFTYTTVASEQISSSLTLRLWTPENYYIYASSPTITLSDDVDFRRLFQRRSKILYWYAESNGMTPSGTITFQPPSGGTVNGKAVDAAQQYNTASGPQAFLVTCSSTTGLTWFVEAIAPSTVTKV